MKIAVASEKDLVSQHFGHCGSFTVYTVENGAILQSETYPNPGHGHGSLPNFLKELGASVVISGGMGEGAYNGLKSVGMEIATGASGTTQSAVEQYLSGALTADVVFCGHHHDHGHGGGCQGTCKCHG